MECSSNKRQRQFVRVSLERDAHLDFGLRKYRCPVGNLSLSGLYVKGLAEQKPGDSCTINLRRAESDPEEIMATGSVVRISDEGMALRFTSMGIDSFLFLQTALLHEAYDPAVLGDEPVNYRLLGA